MHLTLTCIASQNDELPKKDVASSRPLSIQWYNPQGNASRDECDAGSSQAATVMSCTLRVGRLTLEKFGNYTCRARNEYHCSFKRIEINLHGKGRSMHLQLTGLHDFPYISLKNCITWGGGGGGCQRGSKLSVFFLLTHWKKHEVLHIIIINLPLPLTLGIPFLFISAHPLPMRIPT